ncbi:hypothetical protein M9435_004858 [Picochlorum sp. BPE23]|nr:hypothetical protein M9435_004858 [Picochlorum sp. BPE23]
MTHILNMPRIINRIFVFILLLALVVGKGVETGGTDKVGSEVEVRRKVDDAAIDAAILGVEKGLKKQSAQEEKPQPQQQKKKEKETSVEEEKKTEEEGTVVDIKKTSQKKHVDDGAIESAILDRKDGSQVAGKKNDVVEKDGKEDEENEVEQIDNEEQEEEEEEEEEQGGVDEEEEEEEEDDDDDGHVVLEDEDEDIGDDEFQGSEEDYQAEKSVEKIETSDVFSQRMKKKLDAAKQKNGRKTSETRQPVHIKVDTNARYLKHTNTGTAQKNPSSTSMDGADTQDAKHHAANLLQVTVLTVGMALSAGIGAIPFFLVKSLSPTMNGLATAIASGVMFAASFDLVHEGQPYGAFMVLVGILAGTVFIQVIKNALDGMEDVHFGHLHGKRAKRLILIVGIMAAHAIGEGCGVGVSFCGEKGLSQGILTTLAIGVHNIPEGMAKAAVLVSQGASAPEALLWSILTCLPQPLMAVPSYIFVNMFESLLPIALGFAAGCMIWMVFAELLPDALKDCNASHVASAATLSAAALEGFRMLFEYLENSSNVSGIMDGSTASGSSWKGAMPLKIGQWPSLCLLTATLVSSWLVNAIATPVPVVLGFVSIAMAAIGILPISSELIFSDTIPRLHTISAAIVGAMCILIIRNYLLESAWILPRASHAGKLKEDDGSLPAYSSRNGRPRPLLTTSNKPLKTYAPLRTLAMLILTTSCCHAVTSGALLARQVQGTEQAPSSLLTGLFGCLFGVLIGCFFRLWSVRSAGVLSQAFVGVLITGAFIFSVHAGMYDPTSVQPYPTGILDSLSLLTHGALAMSAFFTLAVGMSMNPRYCRFGILITITCLVLVFLTLFVGCRGLGISSMCSIDDVILFL